MIKLYNTLTRKKEEFKPIKKGQVNLYTCGPTVYDRAHIGNLRSYIFADVLRRVLKFNGYAVRWVMNITDVDDKTIKRTVDEFGSKATLEHLREYTERYVKLFKEDLRKINIPIDEPDVTFIRVSDTMEEIKTFIKELRKRGYVYKAADGMYFNIQKYQEDFGDYGTLVGESFLKGKKTGTRVKVDEYEKENISDFALWKGRDPSDGNIFWSDSELGDGRPGWHVECSVINREAFGGRTTDIHTGGVDLIFPHHTNEIAQSQPLYTPFVRYWLHNEHLLVDGKKMAKSEKNFFTLGDLENDPELRDIKNIGLAFRYLTLHTRYRSPMNFTKGALKAANSGMEHLNELRFSERSSETPDTSYEKVFLEDLNDDLNTSGALDTVWQLVGWKDAGDRADALADVLGLRFKTAVIPDNVQKLARERETFRTNKQFAQSDHLRKEINDLGYEVEDTPTGPRLWPKNST